MKRIYILLFVVLASSCERPTQFTEEALQETFTSLNQENVRFQSILEKHKGKKILIDIWASWCRDCIVRLNSKEKTQKLSMFFSRSIELIIVGKKQSISFK